MVRITNNKVFIKILYWGPVASGKTTAVDTLYHIIEKNKMDFIQTGALIKIAMASGSALYFDRGVFQSAKKSSIYFHVYTVADKARFSPLRKKMFMGTDGVFFVFDGQRDRWEDNVESLKELKAVAGNDIIKKLPLVIMLNKVDLENIITMQEIDELLQQEGMWYPPPIVYPTIATMPAAKNVYNAFTECARLASMNRTNPI